MTGTLDRRRLSEFPGGTRELARRKPHHRITTGRAADYDPELRFVALTLSFECLFPAFLVPLLPILFCAAVVVAVLGESPDAGT